MMFQNPIAWLGLAAIAVPILVHLLGRRRARRLAFPTLRFVPASPLPPVRRDRLTDVPLLLVRVAAIATAAVALTQPLWLTASRARDVDRTLSRAVIVDTSASMAPSIERARREAQTLAGEATASRVIETASPAAAVPGALTWLHSQSGRAELVVVSDFQPDAIERADLAGVPAETGIRLIALPFAGPAVVSPATTPLRVLAGSAEQRRADAAVAAAQQMAGTWQGRADRPIAIVYPGALDRSALLAAAQQINRPWMFESIAKIGRDEILADAVALHEPQAPSPGPRAASPEPRAASPGAPAVVIRAPNAEALARAARGSIDGTERLLLFLDADAGSIASAALVAAAARAAAVRPPASELDPVVRTEAEIRSWERPPATTVRPATDPAGRSDGRWLWLVVIALLGLEMLIRRAPPAVAAPAAAPEEHERVA